MLGWLTSAVTSQSVDYSGMSDAQLDGELLNARNRKDQAAMVKISDEISSRLTSAWGILGALAGRQRFPNYATITGFNSSTEARASVAKSATDVATTIGNAAVSGTKTIFWAIFALLVIYGMFYIWLRRAK